MVFPVKQDAFISTLVTKFSTGHNLFKPVEMLYSTKRGLYCESQITDAGPDALSYNFSNAIRVDMGTDYPGAGTVQSRQIAPAMSIPCQDNFNDRIR